ASSKRRTCSCKRIEDAPTRFGPPSTTVGRSEFPCARDSLTRVSHLGTPSKPLKQLRQASFQSFCYSFDIHQRNVPDSSLDPAVIRPVQPAPLCRLLLIDSLFLANTPERTAKADADVERHRVPSCGHAADAYTADESHFY